MALIVASELVLRQLGGSGVPGALPLVQHLTLWLGFLGAAYAAREGKLLAIASSALFPEGRWRNAAAIFAGAVGAAVSILLARASLEMVRLDRDAGGEVALGIPIWVAQLVLPVAFLVLALRLAWMASPLWSGRALATLGLLAGTLLGQFPLWTEGAPKLAGLVVLLLGATAGAPLFVLLGGAAVWLFLTDGVPIAVVPIESYRLAVHPTLPSIPLFTLTGFLLAEGKAALRLLALFRAAVGWLPGGTAVVTAVLCAFFTTFTGGSGVTILALGALLFQTLQAETLPRALLARPADLLRRARPALSAGAAADLLRHRGLRADPGPLQGRHSSRHFDGRRRSLPGDCAKGDGRGSVADLSPGRSWRARRGRRSGRSSCPS